MIEQALSVIDVAQAGAVVMLAFAVVHLWRRLNALTDRFLAYLEDSAERGDIAAQKVIERE